MVSKTLAFLGTPSLLYKSSKQFLCRQALSQENDAAQVPSGVTVCLAFQSVIYSSSGRFISSRRSI